MVMVMVMVIADNCRQYHLAHDDHWDSPGDQKRHLPSEEKFVARLRDSEVQWE